MGSQIPAIASSDPFGFSGYPIVGAFCNREKGIPADAMLTAGCVLYVLKYSTDAFSGLKNAIRMGGDVDSIASICTGILAGRYGIDSLPDFMVENVEGREKIEKLAEDFQTFLQKIKKDPS